jgi:hypothetical protein
VWTGWAFVGDEGCMGLVRDVVGWAGC